ncbi:hypothetical protein HAX54_024034 [Datura stramonium]|uniref:Uncharacterized protein n=1 Tax=Datura stramonium TaxID=4076 RepID=A0ABS8V050_DATST|nr:hypothetical protein [Datura stramonium]
MASNTPAEDEQSDRGATTPGMVQGVTVSLMAHHVPDDASEDHQTGDESSLVKSRCFWVQGLTVDLTDLQRSEGPSLLPSEVGYDSSLLFKGDSGIEGPSGV